MAESIELSEETKEKMVLFFLKTSIPRIIKAENNAKKVANVK